jgi:hypothetical protein
MAGSQKRAKDISGMTLLLRMSPWIDPSALYFPIGLDKPPFFLKDHMEKIRGMLKGCEK